MGISGDLHCSHACGYARANLNLGGGVAGLATPFRCTTCGDVTVAWIDIDAMMTLPAIPSPQRCRRPACDSSTFEPIHELNQALSTSTADVRLHLPCPDCDAPLVWSPRGLWD